MRKEAYFLGSADIARRANVIETNYKTTDGRYILSEANLRRVAFTPEEYQNGLDVEQISDEKAQELIKLNNYHIGE